MAGDRRANTLRRVLRLREIEGMELQRELSEARSTQNRMRDLQGRTNAMAREYSDCVGSQTGAEMTQRLSLAGSLSRLSDQTAEHLREAAEQADLATAKLAKLSHEQERLADRIAELDQAHEARQSARAAEEANGKSVTRDGRLARSLLR